MTPRDAAEALENIRCGLPRAQQAFIRLVAEYTPPSDALAVLADFLGVIESETAAEESEDANVGS
jgi:hypothetical protein